MLIYKLTAIVAILPLFLFTYSCKSEKDVDAIEYFIDYVKNEYSDTEEAMKATDGEEGLVLFHILSPTPENYGRACLLTSCQEARTKIRKELSKGIEDGPLVRQLIKENKSLIFAYEVGNLEYAIYFSPTDLKELCSRNK